MTNTHFGKLFGDAWLQPTAGGALGNRSILGDPPKHQSVMNQKIKFSESFRSFAPSVSAEAAQDYIPRWMSLILVICVCKKKQTRRVERVAGVEPASLAWEARVIPIYDTRSAGVDSNR